MNCRRGRRFALPVLLAGLLLSGCGGGNGNSTPDPPTTTTVTPSVGYQIGVKVEGLANVNGLVLQDNGGDDLAISSSSSSTFATAVANGASYAVTVSKQPATGTCFVTNGTGSVNAANVNVQVTCPWHVAYFAEPTGPSRPTGRS